MAGLISEILITLMGQKKKGQEDTGSTSGV
jgi:hypothetical protein